MNAKTAHDELARRVKLHLVAKEMSQTKVAKAAGVSVTFLNDVIKGRRAWNASIISKIVKVVKIDEEEAQHLQTLGARTRGWEV